MVKIKHDVFVYAEGGGSGAGSSALQGEFRQALAAFFSKTVLGNTRRPRVVVCGGREQAFDMFNTAISQGKNALLLVDSEAVVNSSFTPSLTVSGQPWAHLQLQAGWNKPGVATDNDCHLMTQCMESWLLADWPAVQTFFGQGFVSSVLPAGSVESIPKTSVYATLQRATKDCKTKSSYGKGSHSFKLLALIDPAKVIAASPWAKRLIDELAKRKP